MLVVSESQPSVGRGHKYASRAVLAALLLFPIVGHAQLDLAKRRGGFSGSDMTFLPSYCQDTMGTKGYEGPPGKHWRRVIGPDFQHIHHYCRGLRDMHFAETMRSLKREHRLHLWERAIDEFNYIIQNSNRKMPLMPEVFYRQGESYLALGNTSGAMAAFEAARNLKPDYWPAYTRLADHFSGLGLVDRARELLAAGLQHAPDSNEIRDRLLKLPGGKEIAASVPRPERPAASPASAPSQPADGTAPASAPLASR